MYMCHTYVYVHVLQQQASGFNHMQDVITLAFLGHVCGQKWSLPKSELFMLFLSPQMNLKGE